MKKLLSLLLFSVFLSSASGSHMAGGEIWYEYIGDSINPNRYKIYLRVYREAGPVSLCTSSNCTKTICISSSCFPDQSIQVQFLPRTTSGSSDTVITSHGSIRVPGLYSCNDSLIFMSYDVEQYLFTGIVDLPGMCSDFTFSFSETARNNSDNLLSPMSKNLFLEVLLNNTIGHNNAPEFITPGAKVFCIGNTFSWSHTAIDPDGDSLFYQLSIPLDGSCNFGSQSPTPIGYSSGYHQSSPITSSTPFLFDYTNGTARFTPSQTEIVTFKIDVLEYRQTSSAGPPQLIGTASRDVQVLILSFACGKSSTSIGTIQGSNDTLSSTLMCQDSIISVSFYKNILSSSIAADGSDFALINSQGGLVPIIKAETDSSYSSLPFTPTIHLSLHQPISHNDSLFLYMKTGNDRNGLITTCGIELKKEDSLKIGVRGCASSIGIFENDENIASVYPNPAHTILNIHIDQPVQNCIATLLDATGRRVMELPLFTQDEKVDISQLPPGIYSISLRSDQWNSDIRFQKI